MSNLHPTEPTKSASATQSAAPTASSAAPAARASDALPPLRSLVAALHHPIGIVGSLSRDERRALVHAAAQGEEDGGDPEA